MNLALKDIRRHRTRFALTCLGLGLLLTVVMAMSGIYRGLISDATKVIDAVPGEIWVVQKDTRGPFAESSRLPEDLEFAVGAVRGVRSATPVSFQYVEIARNGEPVRLLLIGSKSPAGLGASHIVAGRAISRKHYEIVADVKSGLGLGERVRMGREDFTVVGLTRGMPAPSGDPVAFVSLADAQEIQFVGDNEATRNTRERVRQAYDRLGAISPLMSGRASDAALEASGNVHYANAIVARLTPAGSLHEVSDSIRRWNHYEVYSADAQRQLLLQGLVEKSKKQLWLFRAILVLVSGVIVALIIYTMTLDKLRDIATLKIIGAADRTINAMILQQALLLGLIGYAIGFALIQKTHTAFPRTVMLERADMIVLFAIVVAISTVASLLGIRRAMRVDPGTALMGG